MPVPPSPATHAVLDRAEANLAASRRLGFERLRLAREWALLHEMDPSEVTDPRCRPTPLGAAEMLAEEYAAAELAVCLQMHPLAAAHLMADAVDIEERLPHLWGALAAGQLEPWVARKIATATSELARDRAQWVDAAIADVLGTLPTGRLLTVVGARVVEADQGLADTKAAQAAARRTVWLGRENDHGLRTLVAQGEGADMAQVFATADHLAHLLRDHGSAEHDSESMDQLRARALGLLANPLLALQLLIGAGEHDLPEQVAEAVRTASPAHTRPRAIVHLHLSQQALRGHGVTRAEELGALTRRQLIDLLGHHHVTLRPVIDLNEGLAADCYEVPAAIAEQLQLAHPGDVFPYAESLGRHQDRDHTVAYDPHGPPGQTTMANLGHLVRRHHRVKTHANGWHVHQVRGRFTWTTPHGRAVVTDHRGTHRLPDSPLEQRLHLILQAA
jgi:hypothetical protein